MTFIVYILSIMLNRKSFKDLITSQLTGDWRTLRRAFRKMDTSSVGTLTLPEFKSVLKLCNGKWLGDEYAIIRTERLLWENWFS